MTAWFKRNSVPITLVLAASVVVILAFELLDTLTTSEPLDAPDGGAMLTVGGLIKVAMFLFVPGSITLAIRRRQRRRSTTA